MARYLLRRVLYAVPILIGVLLVTFYLFYMAVPPRQMAKANLGKNPTEQQVQDWLHTRGYDKPVLEQFKDHAINLFLFKFGKSDTREEEIWDRIKSGIGPSLNLTIFTFTGSVIASISFALFLAAYRESYIDHWGRFFCVLVMSIPFVVYIISGQYVFGKLLNLFPLAGFVPGVGSLRFIALPVVLGVLAGLGSSVRFYRTLILDELNQDYVRTAHAKGLSGTRILFVHVLRNASIPILTSVIMSLPFLIMGNLMLETFFGIPGLGSFTVDAINSQDFATVRAMVFLGSVLYIIGSILTDISYAIVDPRVKYS